MEAGPLRAFYASPYAPEYAWIRNGVARACREHHVQLRVVDEAVPPGGDINASIHHEIEHADFAFAVLTGLNPNVYYELGRLHHAGRPAIMLVDRALTRIPFDLRAFAVVEYDGAGRDERQLATAVGDAIGRLRLSLGAGRGARPSPEATGTWVIDHPFPLEMVRVPAGPLGTFRGRSTTSVSEFWISTQPVTCAQFDAYLSAVNARRFLLWPRRVTLQGRGDRPAPAQWKDAVKFCRWLRRIAGGTVRLPTEAEWMRALVEGRIGGAPDSEWEWCADGYRDGGFSEGAARSAGGRLQDPVVPEAEEEVRMPNRIPVHHYYRVSRNAAYPTRARRDQNDPCTFRLVSSPLFLDWL